MIETGLVYIYSISPARAFRGCGALLEGGYVATCRHVWHSAAPAGQLPSNEPAEVEIEFPFGTKEKAGDGDKYAFPARRARLADACEVVDETAPDLVFLTLVEPRSQPSGVMWLQPAVHERFETGSGFALAGLIGRDKANPNRVSDVRVRAEIVDSMDSEGRRQFTGSNSASYWTTRGASGSPVFLERGQQLAGIISLSETGANEGATHLHEAFVVPATTIRKYLERLRVRLVATEQRSNPSELQNVMATKPPEVPYENRSDVAKAIESAQRKLSRHDTKGALEVLRAMIAKLEQIALVDSFLCRLSAQRVSIWAGARRLLEAKIAKKTQDRARRLVPLLKERAAVERLTFDYDAAKKTLTEVTRLAPDDVWALIGRADLYRITGRLEEAANAFRSARESARRQGHERDLSVSLNKIGDVQVAQGDLAGALKSYQDGLAIFDRLAESNPGNAGWQHNLSVSFIKVGDVQMAQGDLAGALKSFNGGLDIIDRLAKADPGNAEWQRDLSVSYNFVGNVQMAQGDLAGALKSYKYSLAIAEGFAKSGPGNAGRQRDLSVAFNKTGDVQMAQGDLAGALKAYQDSLDIIDRLAKADPGNAEWQRDLSVCYNFVGNAQIALADLAGALKSYNDSLAIIDRMAKSDPGNAGWQRDLSVSYEKAGDVQVAQGDLASALKSYNDSFAIAERLAKSDPGNAEWGRSLAVSFAKLGSVHRESGDSAKARDLLRQGRAIMARLTNLSPDNATWKKDLAWFDGQIAKLAEG